MYGRHSGYLLLGAVLDGCKLRIICVNISKISAEFEIYRICCALGKCQAATESLTVPSYLAVVSNDHLLSCMVVSLSSNIVDNSRWFEGRDSKHIKEMPALPPTVTSWGRGGGYMLTTSYTSIISRICCLGVYSPTISVTDSLQLAHCSRHFGMT